MGVRVRNKFCTTHFTHASLHCACPLYCPPPPLIPKLIDQTSFYMQQLLIKDTVFLQYVVTLQELTRAQKYCESERGCAWICWRAHACACLHAWINVCVGAGGRAVGPGMGMALPHASTSKRATSPKPLSSFPSRWRAMHRPSFLHVSRLPPCIIASTFHPRAPPHVCIWPICRDVNRLESVEINHFSFLFLLHFNSKTDSRLLEMP
jgi:hypothetical protein